jgi:hypothetical protein
MAIPALPTVHSSGRTHRYWCRPKWRGWLRINQLRFSQSSIGASLQDGRLLTRVEEDLRAGRLWVSELCPLNVVYFRGRWFSRDNRRLHVLQRVLQPEQHVRVRFGYVNNLFLSHFSTEDEGGTIRVRPAKNAGRRPPCPPPSSDPFHRPDGGPAPLGHMPTHPLQGQPGSAARRERGLPNHLSGASALHVRRGRPPSSRCVCTGASAAAALLLAALAPRAAPTMTGQGAKYPEFAIVS